MVYSMWYDGRQDVMGIYAHMLPEDLHVDLGLEYYE